MEVETSYSSSGVYRFAHVFDGHFTNVDVFSSVLPVLFEVLGGKDVAVIVRDDPPSCPPVVAASRLGALPSSCLVATPFPFLLAWTPSGGMCFYLQALWGLVPLSGGHCWGRACCCVR